MFIQQGLHEALKRKAASHLPQHNSSEAFEAISRHISHYLRLGTLQELQVCTFSS